MPIVSKAIPLSGYDPRFRELLLRGAKETVIVPCRDNTERVALRNQLQAYRVRCKEAGTEDWEQLYRARVSTPARTTNLIIAPRGSEFDEALSKVTGGKLEVEKLSSDPLADLPAEDNTNAKG